MKASHPGVFLLALSDRAPLIKVHDTVRWLHLSQVVVWPFNRVEVLVECRKFAWEEHCVVIRGE
jgi:hypothetical protein